MSYQDSRIFTLNEPNAPRLNPALACEIGLNESLLLLQIEFFISVSGIEKDGQKWIFNSTRDIRDKWFPFWSHHTINRAINSLESGGYIITTTKYNEKKYDKTRWFALNFQGLSSLKSIMVNVNATPSVQNETGSVQIATGSVQNETTIQETKKETIKRNDVQPPEPTPAASSKVGPSSSSHSESELITTLAGLMALIPKQHRKPSVESTLEKGLLVHTESYIRLSVLYTIANSNGDSWQKFKAYLGKCIDNGWADGWEPDTDETSRLDLEAVKAKFKQIPDETLKPLADAGNKLAIEELERRDSF